MKLFKGLSFLILFYLALFLVYGIDFANIFIMSYLLHEIAHIIVIRLFHFKLEGVYLIPFGGQIKINACKNHSPLIDLAIYTAGPGINALLIFIGYFLGLDSIIRINFTLCFINLLPILPLDGFYIILNLFALGLPYYYAIKIALGISLVLAIIALLLAPLINYSLLILSCYMIIITLLEIKSNHIYKSFLLEKMLKYSYINPNKEIKPTINLKRMHYKGANSYFNLDGIIYYEQSFLKK